MVRSLFTQYSLSIEVTGVDAERVRVFASAVQEASSPSEMMRIVNEFLKSTNAVQVAAHSLFAHYSLSIARWADTELV